MHEIKEKICVCICTYKRPEYLERLLSELRKQTLPSNLNIAVVIVDNDAELSAKPIVNNYISLDYFPISYFHEPEKNIAKARNMAVKHANGDFIAFIDDDEFPVEIWLNELYKAIKKFNSTGVLGPVKPHFEAKQPSWLIKSRLCERPSFETGTMLKDPKYTRTGNVLLKKECFNDSKSWFNPEFGLTGGEDVDFFKRMIDEGAEFVWCDEGYVMESVPEERCKRSYFLKRALLRGNINSRKASFFSIIKSVIAFMIYTPLLPITHIFGHHLFMKYLVKDLDHVGKILGVFKLNFIKKRTF